MNYNELRNKQQKEVDNFPFGFAFSTKQFNEMMASWGLNPETDLDKIYSIGGGGYIQKKDSDAMDEMFARHEEERAELMEDLKELEEAIFYEMKNHEYFYNYQKNYDVLNCFGSVEYNDYDDPDIYFDQLGWSEDKRQAFRNARNRMYDLEDEI